MTSPAIYGQSFELIASDPGHISDGIALETTVSFTFSQPLNTHRMDPDNLGEVFVIYPENEITIHSHSFSDNNTTVSMEVTHSPDTDYVWIFHGPYSESGEVLSSLGQVNYTTMPSVSNVSVEGSLWFVNNPFNPYLSVDFAKALPGEVSKPGIRDLAARTGGGQTGSEITSAGVDLSHTIVLLVEDVDWLDEIYDVGPGGSTKNAGVADADGNYRIENVRPGLYYLCAIYLDISTYGMDIFGVGCYADEDDEPIAITVQDANLTDMDFPVQGFLMELLTPVEAGVAFELAVQRMSNMNPVARPLGLWGEEDYMFEGDSPPRSPSGLSPIWTTVFYDDATADIYIITTLEDYILHVEVESLYDFPEDERPDFDLSLVKSIPDNFVDGSAVAEVVMGNGLENILADLPYEMVFVTLDYDLNSFWFEHPELLDEDSNPFWFVDIDIFAMNHHDGDSHYASYWFLVDAVTGAFLGSSAGDYGPAVPVHFSDVHGMARDYVAGIDPSVELILVYGREDVYLPVPPQGSSSEWMLAFADLVNEESVVVLNTYGMEIDEVQIMRLEDIPEEDRPPMEIIRAVPADVICSAQALATAMQNGMSDQMANVPEGNRYSVVQYRLSRFYFEFPDLLDESTNPFWNIRFIADVWDDHFTEPLYRARVDFFVDAVTGDFLASQAQTPSSAEEEDAVPVRLRLFQNYPNPFNPVTTVSWEMDAPSQVTLRVYDLLGRNVAVLADDRFSAGTHSAHFDAGSLPSGVYIYRLESGSQILTRKMMLVK
ncbi:T9SS type A sorting domain-containing protein [Balneolales bacterium ANBcel1]|nr:T9SS type A sorting domain-containing protein [Balneolales bacterium ANBcel1]